MSSFSEDSARYGMEGWPQERRFTPLAVVYLFFQPKRFFTGFVVRSAPITLVVTAWTFGMAATVDRVESRAMFGRPVPFADDWVPFWSAIMVAGALGGLFYYAVGGWWYRTRLRWSGAVDADSQLARRVYLFASQVVAFPTLLCTVIETCVYATPRAAIQAESAWYLLMLVFPFWSTWNSYVGVRTLFDVRRLAGCVWFLILPSLVYVLAFGGVVGALFVQGPDVDDAEQFRSERFQFSYPGNWWIAEDDEDYDPNRYILVEPFQDAMVIMMLYESDQPIDEELQNTLDAFRTPVQSLQATGDLRRWGTFQGKGKFATGRMDNTPTRVTVFIAPLGEGRFLEVQQLCFEDDAAKLEPGFDLIRSTLQVTF